MVVLVHMSALETPAQLPYLKMLAVEYIRQWGIGVVIFFVLSGFLITTRYADRVEPGWAWMKRYLQNRFARIYPIYCFLSALAFAVMVLRPTHGWWEWSAAFTLKEKLSAVLLNLTQLRGYFNQFAVLGLPTAWSLTVEETFYLGAAGPAAQPPARCGISAGLARVGLPAGGLLLAFPVRLWLDEGCEVHARHDVFRA